MTPSLSCSLPVGDQVARRGNPFSRAVARACLRLAGWKLAGAVPDLPKMVLIGGPHTSNMDGVIAIGGLIVNRRYLAATVQAPFLGTAIRHSGHPHHESESPTSA